MTPTGHETLGSSKISRQIRRLDLRGMFFQQRQVFVFFFFNVGFEVVPEGVESGFEFVIGGAKFLEFVEEVFHLVREGGGGQVGLVEGVRVVMGLLFGALFGLYRLDPCRLDCLKCQ